MKSFIARAITLAFAIAATSNISAQSLKVDAEHSVVKWEGGKVVGGSHNGFIQITEGWLKLEDNQLHSGEIVIDMASMSNADLDAGYGEKLVGHLMSDDFFGVGDHPTATLRIEESTPFVDGIAQVTATVTIKDVSERLSFEVSRKGNSFVSAVEIDRSKFNVRYGSGSFFDNLGDDMIKDVFTLEVNLEII